MKVSTNFFRLFFIIAAFSFSITSFSQNCPSGLVSYWKMDETGGTTFADELSGHDAARTSELTYHNGIVGNSQYFSFWDRDKAEIQNSPDFNFPANSGFSYCLLDKIYRNTVRFKRRPGSYRGQQRRLEVGAPNTGFWASGVNGSGKVNFMLADDTGTKIDLEGDGHYNDGQWHQVTCVHTADNRTSLYVDGVMTDNTNYAYSQGFSNNNNVQIGCLYQNGNPEYYYMGDVDEIGIFNRAISTDEIDQIISSGYSGLGMCNTGQSSTCP